MYLFFSQTVIQNEMNEFASQPTSVHVILVRTCIDVMCRNKRLEWVEVLQCLSGGSAVLPEICNWSGLNMDIQQ
jgi:hypothetical protein